MGRPGEKRLLTPTEEATVRDAVARGCTQTEAARLAGIPRRLLQTRLSDQLADVRVGRGRGVRESAVDPTPEEIAAAMLKIRRDKGHIWCGELHRHDRVGKDVGHG